jgi:hypothetical protein
MTEFNRGAESVRDNILASIIGLQNGIGHNNPDDPTYKAYQKVYNLIKDRYGGMFENFQDNGTVEDQRAALGFKQPTVLVNPFGIKIYTGTKGKEDWCIEIPKELAKKKCSVYRCNGNFVLYGVTEENALSVAKEFTNLAKEMRK